MVGTNRMRFYIYSNNLQDVFIIKNKYCINSLYCWNRKWLNFAFASSIEPCQSAYLRILNRPYTVGWPNASSYLDIPKNENEKLQKHEIVYII